MSFWWCLTHGHVEGSEQDNAGCANMDRLGPYDTREQAGSALTRTWARTAEQDAREQAEDDWRER